VTWRAQTIARQVSGAAMWTYAGVFSDRAMRFVVLLIVARLVPPAAFGTVLLSLLAVEALQALLNTGLPTALLQQSEAPRPLLDTAFLINMALCALTSAALFLGALPLATLLKAPAAAALLRVLAITPLLSGLGAVHVALIQRDLGFKALAGRQAASSLVASLIAVLLAIGGLGVWALVARALIQAVSGTVLAWSAAAYRPSLRFDASSVRGVAGSGARLWAAGLASLVNARGFDLLAGVVLGAAALGALRIAGQTVLLLIELSAGPLTALGFALLSRARQDQARFKETLVTLAHVAALLIFPAFAGLYVIADPLLPLMFGARWAPAAGITPYMCAIAPALYFQLLTSAALFASNRSDRILHWALIEAAVTAAFGLIAARFGLTGLAIAGTLRLYLMMPLGWRWLRRDVGIHIGALISPAAPCLAASVLMAVTVAVAKARLAHVLPPTLLTAALIAIGVIVYGLLLPFTARRLWRRIVAEAAPEDPGDQRHARAPAAAPAQKQAEACP
jgi:O-antigen/teichoic acid export membrane protein